MYYEQDFCPKCHGWGFAMGPGCTGTIGRTCSNCDGEGWVPINIELETTNKPIKDLRGGHRLDPEQRRKRRESV